MIKQDKELCPYCGAPLLTRTDYRTHLTLKLCQGDRPDISPFKDFDDQGPQHGHVDKPVPQKD